MEIKKHHIFLFSGFLLLIFLISFFVSKKIMSSQQKYTTTEIKKTIPSIDKEATQPAQSTSSHKAIPATADIDTEKFKTALEHLQKKRIPANTEGSVRELSENTLPIANKWKLWLHTKIISSESKTTETAIGQISNLIVIRDNDANAADLKQFSLQNPVAVFNERLQRPGIITGLVKIETSQRELLENDLLTERARITNSFEPIQTYFITGTDEVFNLEQLYTNLKSKPYIKNIELDVLSRSYGKK
jgi:ABC-type Na+ efflux pump permease subunit